VSQLVEDVAQGGIDEAIHGITMRSRRGARGGGSE